MALDRSKRADFIKRDEVDGCMEALHLCDAIDLLQIVEDVGWRGVRIDGGGGAKKGRPAAFPVSRRAVEISGISPYRRPGRALSQSLGVLSGAIRR